METFGNRTLLILDGLNEHALGQNVDVLKIVQWQKLSDCTILLTSRPHSTKDIETFFPTIVRVYGFTRKKAKKIASKIIEEKNKVKAVLKFNSADFREDISLYQCPILLSFMCLLVREDDIDLSSKIINTGEIYTRMVRCLCKKFTICKDIKFQDEEFIKTLILER